MFDTLPDTLAARTPRVLWIELTSKCPADCVFCSRALRRGAGEHMPLPVYEELIRSLSKPRKIVLNYSGESTLHPEIIRAIRLARAAGAFVELVSVLTTVPLPMLAPLATSGLNRLTVSVHALDADRYREIYRYSSAAALRERLDEFTALCRGAAPRGPAIDLGFVAMRRNLDQLAPVARYAGSLGIEDILLFPVMRRDEIPVSFAAELQAPALPTESFRRELRGCVDDARRAVPGARFTICNPAFDATRPDEPLGQTPRDYPWPLPDGARIHTCEQNPFETAHVLANGDVVPCEVMDRMPLGNLHQQSLYEIWHGEGYTKLRQRYQHGEIPECRHCIWKKAYRPAPLESRILANRGGHAQLLHGWHDSSAGDAIRWSAQEAAAMLQPRRGSRTLHVSGILPPGPDEQANELVIRCGGREVGRVANPWQENIPFGLDFPVPPDAGAPWLLTFETKHMFRPSERNVGSDQRDLGFALIMTASQPAAPAAVNPARSAAIERARRWVGRADWIGRHAPRAGDVERLAAAGGVSIVVPERDNVGELSACLAGAEEASRAVPGEPVEILVVVNGSPAERYEQLRLRYSPVRWFFHSEPLGFVGAVREGLRHARFPWVYLLNSDATMRTDTLTNLLPLRRGDLFAASSQIFFKDGSRFREETNLASLLLEDGLVTVHDRIPDSDGVTETFYSGGGASLFRASLLRAFVRQSGVYEPFYWEDVEWGWRARKLGFRNVFCASSVVHHRQRATIAKFYGADEIETILQRNRLLFQLRNVTEPGLTARALEEAGRVEDEIADRILSPAALWGIARSRVWNHRMPVDEGALLAAGRTLS